MRYITCGAILQNICISILSQFAALLITSSIIDNCAPNAIIILLSHQFIRDDDQHSSIKSYGNVASHFYIFLPPPSSFSLKLLETTANHDKHQTVKQTIQSQPTSRTPEAIPSPTQARIQMIFHSFYTKAYAYFNTKSKSSKNNISKLRFWNENTNHTKQCQIYLE